MVEDKNRNKVDLVDDPYVLGDLVRCCEKSCEIEEELYDSLISCSARLITCISVLSVALVTGFGICAEEKLLDSGCQEMIALAGISLVVAFFMTLISQWRFRIGVPAYPLTNVLYDFSNGKIEDRVSSTYYYVATISKYHESIAKRNGVLKKLLVLSLGSIASSVAFSVAWTVSLVV